MRFVIHVLPPHPSAGGRALYLLRDGLERRGHDASTEAMGQIAWQHQRDAVHIYPEIVSGNPSGAEKVVRWLLYWPQLPSPWAGPDDLFVTWDDRFWPGAPRLMLDVIPSRYFFPKMRAGEGTLLWVYKGERDLTWCPMPAQELTFDAPMPVSALGNALRGADLLYSCDPQSSLNIESVICGTPVLFSPTAAAAPRPWMMYYGWAYHPDQLGLAREEITDAAAQYEGVRRDIAGDVDNLVELCRAKWGD